MVDNESVGILKDSIFDRMEKYVIEDHRQYSKSWCEVMGRCAVVLYV